MLHGVTDAAPMPALPDVHTLIDASQPRARVPWIWYALGTLMLAMLAAAYFADDDERMQTVVRAVSSLMMLVLLVTMMALSWNMARRHREEHRKLEAIEELLQLRRWQEAAALLFDVLTRPMRTQNTRIQALIYLSTLLTRYHRFADAITVQEYLLDHVQMDGGTEHGLRLGRAMAMLREDHLVDVDRALSDLRRGDRAKESGGLALVEIYRDVKTGHPDEAIAIFEARQHQIREQLGHRLGDAYALVAQAHDQLGDEAGARAAYERATILVPAPELHRRYPETAPLAAKYPAFPAPAGVVA